MASRRQRSGVHGTGDRKKPKPPVSLASILDDLVTKGGKKYGMQELVKDRERRHEHNDAWLDLMYKPKASSRTAIPWTKYSEVEIQTILKIHFEDLGYKITWRHLDDASNEKGIDLECFRESDKSKILVAVKKNPKKDALAQLVELKSHPATKRVYVYVGGAVQSFRDQSATFNDSIEVWDEDRLDKQLNATGMTLNLKVDNSTANDAMFSITKCIYLLTSKPYPEFQTPANPAEMLEMLWGLKDRVVTVNQNLRMAQDVFENEDNFAEMSDKQVQNLVLSILGFVYQFGLRSINYDLSHPSEEFKSLLHTVHQKTSIRSNWSALWIYRVGFVPGRVEQAHQEYEGHEGEWRKELESIKGVDNSALFEKSTNIEHAANTFRVLANWADGLEGTVDFLFTRVVRGVVRA